MSYPTPTRFARKKFARQEVWPPNLWSIVSIHVERASVLTHLIGACARDCASRLSRRGRLDDAAAICQRMKGSLLVLWYLNSNLGVLLVFFASLRGWAVFTSLFPTGPCSEPNSKHREYRRSPKPHSFPLGLHLIYPKWYVPALPPRLLDTGTNTTYPEQPPKRKAPAEAPKPRQSKLAKEHNVTAQEESEIREAFSLFSEPMEGERYGVIPTSDVRSAMMYVPPSFPHFLNIPFSLAPRSDH